MTPRGFRETDRALLSGAWLPGELLGWPVPDWPALADLTTVPPPADHDEELCVLDGVGFLRYADIDWVHRHARLEIGQCTGVSAVDDSTVADLLRTAVDHGFTDLNLHRLYGWHTPAAGTAPDSLVAAGFRHEATVPAALWFDGRPVTRELWGEIRHD
jgi:RimJ/RimL family protein N-acetyltransferase